MVCQALLHSGNTAVRTLASAFLSGAPAMTIQERQQVTAPKQETDPVKKNRRDTHGLNKHPSTLSESKMSGKYLKSFQQKLNFDLHVKGRYVAQ